MYTLKEKIEYDKNGPKAVILFHAYTGSPNDVNSLGRALERENYTVLKPTFDGHNLKDPNEILKYGIEDWVKNGEDAYQQLVDDGFTDISVFGLSLGGIIATHVMLKFNLKKYGVFSSPVISSKDSNVPENFWLWYAFKMKKLGATDAEIADKKTEVMNRLHEVLNGIHLYSDAMEEKFSTVTSSVFIGQGGADEMIDPDQAYDLKNAFENADIDFHWYEGAPHVITVGRVGKELQADVLNFLGKN